MYIGVDLGTTGCRAILYEECGAQRNESYVTYPLITKSGRVGQNPEDWWNAVKKTVSEVSDASVKAICISTQGISFVPVDRTGGVLSNAVSWLDSSAQEETAGIDRRFGAGEIYRRTGKPLRAAYTLPKLIRFRREFPEVWKAADKFLTPLDFLNMRLTGFAVTDYTVASGTMLFSLDTRKWDDELLDYAELSQSRLPEVMEMGGEIGTLLPETADGLGLSCGCRVVMGGQDQKLAAVGAGIVPEVCTVSIGTASAVTKMSSSVAQGIPVFALNAVEDIAETSAATTGAAITWLSGILGKSYAQMNEMAERAALGAGGVRFSPRLDTGTVISGITLAVCAEDIVRALYEGICADIAECVKALGGAKRLIVFGGGAESDILCSILAKTANAEVGVSAVRETAARGAAMLASGMQIESAGIGRRYRC